MRARIGLWILLAGCSASDDLAADDFMDEPLPPAGCDTDGATTGCEESSGGGVPTTCIDSSECQGGFCTASFNGNIGQFECHSQCIDMNDESKWCLDAAACCDPDAVCSPRGYCLPGPPDVGTSSSEGSSEGSGTADETGSDSGSSGTASESGGGSSTGGAT